MYPAQASRQTFSPRIFSMRFSRNLLWLKALRHIIRLAPFDALMRFAIP
jgi:hypothetical protein